MNLDGTAIGAVFTFLGIVVTATAGVYLGTRTNKSEKEATALAAIEAKQADLDAKAEAINLGLLRLRDEEIAILKRRLHECQNRLGDVRKEDA